ncbi:MAG: hypothetical protein C0432_02530 [Candidatus Puniceispirillum sp.]|nr:hypothetical protein [Candidatus Pelagibacter sp.]MBA4283151.1 hypothetical protein [Candidatus Puniceispirillum sp.]
MLFQEYVIILHVDLVKKMMMKKILNVFTIFLFVIQAYGSVDIETANKGEQQMIQALRSCIQSEKQLAIKNIIIGAGHSGCEAFKMPSSSDYRILLIWQWLDALKDISNDIIIVVPKHAVDEKFDFIKNRGQKIITIDGVLHGKTIDFIRAYESPAKIISAQTKFIIMLAGDTEQSDGRWVKYDRAMVNSLMNQLPQNQEMLFLNGPRTGKYLEKSDEVDPTAHRATTDYITQFVMDQNKPLWKIEDFQFGVPSLWDAALKFCFDNKGVGLILPGESTSMISEALSLGIKPIIYEHDAMTSTSKIFVKDLYQSQRAFAISEINREDPSQVITDYSQTPLADQILCIKSALIDELKK